MRERGLSCMRQTAKHETAKHERGLRVRQGAKHRTDGYTQETAKHDLRES